MFGFIKKCFFTAMTFLSCNALKCVLMSNQECKVRPAIMNINSNELSFYIYGIAVNKCSGSCNDINNPYAKLCVLYFVKDMNIKIFNLMSEINETRHASWHETCACKYRLDANVFNDKQRWNNDKCRWECKELIDKGRCDDGFIWNPIICECECDKSCDTGGYLDYINCQCRKRLIDKLVDECSEDINGNKMIYNVTLNDHENVYKSCAICIILLARTFIIIMGTGSACIYFYWHMIKNCFNKLPY